MGRHVQIHEENIVGGKRKIYELDNHVQKIEDFLVSSTGSKLESVLTFEDNRIVEYVRYFPSEGSIPKTYRIDFTGQDRLVLRSEAAKHVRSLETEFRYSGQVK